MTTISTTETVYHDCDDVEIKIKTVEFEGVTWKKVLICIDGNEYNKMSFFSNKGVPSINVTK